MRLSLALSPHYPHALRLTQNSTASQRPSNAAILATHRLTLQYVKTLLTALTPRDTPPTASATEHLRAMRAVYNLRLWQVSGASRPFLHSLPINELLATLAVGKFFWYAQRLAPGEAVAEEQAVFRFVGVEFDRFCADAGEVLKERLGKEAETEIAGPPGEPPGVWVLYDRWKGRVREIEEKWETRWKAEYRKQREDGKTKG
ncbi:hypothetical protein EDC01DRAFT_746779 [Geopyxis carbonaria]|nr:hypothetical protein EDC01DRAFT_746779 [Geopyxis carbonaria]